MSNSSFIDDIYNDYDFDRYLDNLQNIVEDSVYYVCSCCNKECNPIIIDDSFGFNIGSISSTYEDIQVLSDCCEAPIVNIRT